MLSGSEDVKLVRNLRFVKFLGKHIGVLYRYIFIVSGLDEKTGSRLRCDKVDDVNFFVGVGRELSECEAGTQ